MKLMQSLHVDGIQKSYNNKILLNDIFISCNKGEIKGVIGRNGSGKSTLFKIIFGIERSESKFIKVGNKIIKNISQAKNLINYLPQDNFLPNSIQIRTLINLFIHKENRKIVIDNEYIKPLLNKRSQDLSSGERRIVEILLIVHSKGDFALLDEPFNGLSPIMKNYIVEYIKEVKSSKGYIITDHDYVSVMSLADKIMYLENGALKELKVKNELYDLNYLPINNR